MPGVTDKNAELDSMQLNDGEMVGEVMVESMQSVSECTMKGPSEFGSGNTARCEHHNNKEKIAPEKNTSRDM